MPQFNATGRRFSFRAGLSLTSCLVICLLQITVVAQPPSHLSRDVLD